MFEFDWLAQNPNSRGLDRLHLFTPKVMVGVAGNIEVSAQVPVHHREFTTDAFLESGVKWKFAASEKKGLAAAVGSLLITPVNNQVFADTYTLVYANISKQLKAGKYGPRLTAGPYGVLFSDFWLGPKAGAMLGYEQPIHAKARIVADWYSGQNGLGYAGYFVHSPREQCAERRLWLRQ